MWRVDLDPHNIQPDFRRFEDKNIKHLCSSLNIVIQSFFDYFTCFRLRFPESEGSFEQVIENYEFEPANPASERPQTQALDRASTGIGIIYNNVINTVIIK